MKLKPLKEEIKAYLRQHNLEKKFAKAVRLFEDNPLHPSLNTEILQPPQYRIYSFRIDQKYRALFIQVAGEAEILAITKHYRKS
jgi:Txe/YoeB family toxin of Txe-Axe toxin-antitoxin module